MSSGSRDSPRHHLPQFKSSAGLATLSALPPVSLVTCGTGFGSVFSVMEKLGLRAEDLPEVSSSLERAMKVLSGDRSLGDDFDVQSQE